MDLPLSTDAKRVQEIMMSKITRCDGINMHLDE